MRLPSFISALSSRAKLHYLGLVLLVIAGGIGGYVVYRNSLHADYINPIATPSFPFPGAPSELLVQVAENGAAPSGVLNLDSTACANPIGGVSEEQGSYSLYVCSSPSAIDFTTLTYTDYTSGITYTLLGGNEDASYEVVQGANTTLRATITNGRVQTEEDTSGAWQDITGQDSL